MMITETLQQQGFNFTRASIEIQQALRLLEEQQFSKQEKLLLLDRKIYETLLNTFPNDPLLEAIKTEAGDITNEGFNTRIEQVEQKARPPYRDFPYFFRQAEEILNTYPVKFEKLSSAAYKGEYYAYLNGEDNNFSSRYLNGERCKYPVKGTAKTREKAFAEMIRTFADCLYTHYKAHHTLHASQLWEHYRKGGKLPYPVQEYFQVLDGTIHSQNWKAQREDTQADNFEEFKAGVKLQANAYFHKEKITYDLQEQEIQSQPPKPKPMFDPNALDFLVQGLAGTIVLPVRGGRYNKAEWSEIKSLFERMAESPIGDHMRKDVSQWSRAIRKEITEDLFRKLFVIGSKYVSIEELEKNKYQMHQAHPIHAIELWDSYNRREDSVNCQYGNCFYDDPQNRTYAHVKESYYNNVQKWIEHFYKYLNTLVHKDLYDGSLSIRDWNFKYRGTVIRDELKAAILRQVYGLKIDQDHNYTNAIDNYLKHDPQLPKVTAKTNEPGRAIKLKLIWKNTGKDNKGIIDGEKYIQTIQGSMPLEDLSEEEINNRFESVKKWTNQFIEHVNFQYEHFKDQQYYQENLAQFNQFKNLLEQLHSYQPTQKEFIFSHSPEVIPIIKPAKPIHSLTAGKLRQNFIHSPMLLGKQIEILMPNGEKHHGQFAIVELDEIIASHEEQTFSSSKGYPLNSQGENINDRNYKDDPNAQAKVVQVAQELEPAILITTSRTPAGTPIISKDGLVVSGNNRIMSIKLAKNKYPENYEAYKKLLLEEIEAFGIERVQMIAILMGDKILDPRKPSKSFSEHTARDYIKIKNPVLVRFDFDFPEYTTLELSKYNKDTKKSERPIDKAIKLSHILRENEKLRDAISQLVGEYETLSEFYASLKDQKRLAQLLVDGNILTPQERPSYYSESGFNEAGKDLIESILASIVLKKEALVASEMSGVKRLRAILITSLPVLVKNASLKEGQLTGWINEAVVLEKKIHSSGLSFADYLSQQNLFEGIPEEQTFILNRLLNTGRNNFKKSLDDYNQSIQENQGESLFGTRSSPKEIFRHYIEQRIDQADLKRIQRIFGMVETIEPGDHVEFLDKEKGAIYEQAYVVEVHSQKVKLQTRSGPKEVNRSEIRVLEKHKHYKEKYGYDFEDIDRLAKKKYFGEHDSDPEDIKLFITHERESGSGMRAMYSMGQALLKEFAADYVGRWAEDQNHYLIDQPIDEEITKKVKLICRLTGEKEDDCIQLKALMYKGDYLQTQYGTFPFFEDYHSPLFLEEVRKFKDPKLFLNKYAELSEYIDVKDTAQLGIIKVKDTNWYPTKEYVDYSKNPEDHPFFEAFIAYVKRGGGIPPIIAEKTVFNNGKRGYTVRDGLHRLSAYEHAGLEYIPALVYEKSINTLTRSYDNPHTIGIEDFLQISFNDLYLKAHEEKPLTSMTVQGSYYSYRRGEVPNLLIPTQVREPLSNRDLSEEELEALMKQETFKDLLVLTEKELPFISPRQMFELIQLTHPDHYGIQVSRMDLLDEWAQRGEAIFQALGLPTANNTLYVHKTAGYSHVMTLFDVLTQFHGDGSHWWSVAEHYLPMADLEVGLKIVLQELNTLRNQQQALLNSKTGKPMGKHKEQYNDLGYDIKKWESSRKLIERNIHKPMVGNYHFLTAGSFTSKEGEVKNVLIPTLVREPLASQQGSSAELKAWLAQSSLEDLKTLKEIDLPALSAPQMFELIQLGHPNNYGIAISRAALIREWEKRGEQIFIELGLPISIEFPYVHKTAGYGSVETLKSTLGDDRDTETWWSTAAHYLPVADMEEALNIIKQTEYNLKRKQLALVNSNTGKPYSKTKSEFQHLEFELKELGKSRKVIEQFQIAYEPFAKTNFDLKEEKKGTTYVGTYKGIDHPTENILISKLVREPFASHHFKDLIKRFKKGEFADLLKLQAQDLPTIGPAQMYELIKLSDPSHYKIAISKAQLTKEWERRGKEIFQALEFPVDSEYPYIHHNGSYELLGTLQGLLDEIYESKARWANVAQNYYPLADPQKAIEGIESAKEKLNQILGPLLHPKTGKILKENRQQALTLTGRIKRLDESKSIIEKYFQPFSHPIASENTDLALKEKEAEALLIKLRLTRKRLELQKKKAKSNGRRN